VSKLTGKKYDHLQTIYNGMKIIFFYSDAKGIL